MRNSHVNKEEWYVICLKAIKSEPRFYELSSQKDGAFLLQQGSHVYVVQCWNHAYLSQAPVSVKIAMLLMHDLTYTKGLVHWHAKGIEEQTTAYPIKIHACASLLESWSILGLW